MTKIIIDGTAKGFGSDRYRWVSGLSSEAKEALKSNSALVICERPFNDAHGNWYVVTYSHGRYNHRLPNEQEREMIENV